MEIKNTRHVDNFFNEAVNAVFKNPEKTAFFMDGSLGVGKSSNFLMRAMYVVSSSVKPIMKNGNFVRESIWAGVRESENSAVATFIQLLENSIFTPEIMALEDSPVTVSGSHPTIIRINHNLDDGTILDSKIECHGFNNEKAANRLRTREYLGGLIPEAQGVPYHIVETVIERCGRWRTDGMYIEKDIEGELYRLTGVTGLAIVLCDINIPPRPHELYTAWYDVVDKDSLPIMFITPPSPLLRIPFDKASQEVKDKYPVTRYEGKKVVWIPNPKVYNMTRHYEETDSDGNKVAWTGYKYWLKRLHNTDSHVRRYIVGEPDNIGGEAAVYNTFIKNDSTVTSKELLKNGVIYAGFDPGGYAAIELCQIQKDNILHWFKEFIIEPSDRVSTRRLFREFFFPWCRKHLSGYTVHIIPDPASTSLGKNIMTGSEESVLFMIKDEVNKENKTSKQVNYIVKPCYVNNQATNIRINSLGYFIDSGKCTVDPIESPVLVTALGGGYQRKKLASGIISDTINKDNPYSHPAEAAQYAAVNILHDIKKGNKNESKRKPFQLRRSTR